MNRLGWLLLVICAVTLLAAPLGAQTAVVTGTIRGVVTDQSGAVVTDAAVTVTNTGTDRSRTVTTNSSGEYVAPDLPTGNYTVTVKKANFRETAIKDVELHVASVAEVNAQLQVGKASEVMTIEANAVQVQTTTAAVGDVVDGTQVRELPLNGGNFVGLTLLQPGVSAMSGPGGNLDASAKGILGGVDISVNGNPVTNNLFLLDGANNNDKGSNRTILIYPAVDSIAEFKMLQNAYGPEYGQASGAVISVITRSGENAFHGTVNYYGRNDALDSFEYFAARSKSALTGKAVKDELRRNDYGYNFSGPITASSETETLDLCHVKVVLLLPLQGHEADKPDFSAVYGYVLRANSEGPSMRVGLVMANTLLFQADRFIQRQTPRRTAYEECIVSRYQLPDVFVDVEDGKIFLIDLQGYFSTLSWI